MPDRKLHICLVTNEFPSLTETFITTKALELVKKGHRVTVIKNQENKIFNSSHIALVNQSGIEVLSAIHIHSIKDLLKTVFTYPQIFFSSFSLSIKSFSNNIQQSLKNYLISQHPFDIVHVEFSGLAISYQKALEKTTAVTIVSCRGTAEKVKPLSDPHRKEQLQQLFSTVQAIHCVSEDMVKTIQPYCNNSKKIFINRPSVDAEIFCRKNPYPLKTGGVNILSIGRFTFQKGYIIGLMALKLLLERGVSFKWTIVGEGALKEEMLFHIHTLGLQNVVLMVGKKNRDEILELYNSTDIFLLTSVYEGIANVCLEAMSMELPVIATKSGGMEEVIEHGVNGLLCNIYDPADLANAISVICNDAELRQKLGSSARQKILNEFTIQRQANIFEQKYLELTKS